MTVRYVYHITGSNVGMVNNEIKYMYAKVNI